MATLNMTAAAVLDTVTEVAGSATAVVKTISSTAHMLHAHVSEMQRDQTRDLIINRKVKDASRLQSKSQEIVLMREQSRLFCNSETRKSDFDEVYAELKLLLD